MINILFQIYIIIQFEEKFDLTQSLGGASGHIVIVILQFLDE